MQKGFNINLPHKTFQADGSGCVVGDPEVIQSNLRIGND
jgi:hypothetical protein